MSCKWRVAALIDRGVEFRMLRLHGERLADIVLAEPESDGGLPESGTPADAAIEAVGLGFRYAEGEPWVLRDCSFRIGAGESVAIVGASGCGKTTLAKLLLGLLPATEGGIRWGGTGIRQLGSASYRKLVAAVMQDDHLFAGSIAENIAFGDEDADPLRIEEAARQAAVHDEIAAMPMGYHSLIGDMGTTLSGGQKQRVILARALYRKPQLLVLDEATSHLDVGREREVNEAVRRLQLTRIIIAHRPETIASADRVLELRDGRICERPRSDGLAVGTAPAMESVGGIGSSIVGLPAGRRRSSVRRSYRRGDRTGSAGSPSPSPCRCGWEPCSRCWPRERSHACSCSGNTRTARAWVASWCRTSACPRWSPRRRAWWAG